MAPLYNLLWKNTRWSWTVKEDAAFYVAKKALLQADSLLVHFDNIKPLVLMCDASPTVIGVVLSHTMEYGSNRPIAFASRTLKVAEKKYAQLEKEGLAIVFGTKKFDNYLYGQTFTIKSDHKSLFFLFRERKDIPRLASACIQRWALTLKVHYLLQGWTGISNADALSRLPLPVTTSSDCLHGELVNLLDHLSTTLLSGTEIRQHTNRDPILTKVRKCVLSGWPI